MILQLIYPADDNRRKVLKSFLTGYLSSYEHVIVYNKKERSTGIVIIFIKETKFDLDKFETVLKEFDDEEKVNVTLFTVTSMSGKVQGYIWAEQERELLCKTWPLYCKWKSGETIEGVAETIRKEVNG